MQQQQKQSVKKLAKYALNQLMADTELSEVYFNLDLYEKLTTDEAEQNFLAKLHRLAHKQGRVLDGERLRSYSDLETFLNNAAGNTLSSLVKDGIVNLTLKAGDEGDVIAYSQLTLSSIPQLILKQTLPATIEAFLAFVYFNNTQQRDS